MRNNPAFPFLFQLLPKDNERHKKWVKSLKKRPVPWNKGKNKTTDESVRKISDTFKRKKLDNFAKWRNQMRIAGKIRSSYPAFLQNKELAFLIGLTLGDGNIQKFPRTERLLISLNTKYPKLIEYASLLVGKFFEKEAKIKKVKDHNCIRVGIYQKKISKRLGIPVGDRKKSNIEIPDWILDSKDYLIYYLKGLFEAEGSICVHLPTYTYNFAFANRNETLLNNVEKGLKMLGFHPEVRINAIRLRKKAEVECFRKLICFRKYNAG